MRIFFAGSSGVIGTRLVPLLVGAGHFVAGMTRSPAKVEALEALGAEPIVCDVYDSEALAAAVAAFKPDAVLDQLTDLPDDVSQLERLAGRNDRMWGAGTRSLLAAAESAGARRTFVQSLAWELEGARSVILREHERMVLDAGGVVIRYGQLYGPGTYYETELPPAPRIEVGEAARRTVPVLSVPAGIVELVESPQHAINC